MENLEGGWKISLRPGVFYIGIKICPICALVILCIKGVVTLCSAERKYVSPKHLVIGQLQIISLSLCCKVEKFPRLSCSQLLSLSSQI